MFPVWTVKRGRNLKRQDEKKCTERGRRRVQWQSWLMSQPCLKPLTLRGAGTKDKASSSDRDLCAFFFMLGALHVQKFGSRGNILKDFLGYLKVLLKPYLHSNRVQYLYETHIVFHFNENIHSAVKHNRIEPESAGNHFCSLCLLSFSEFCVSDV